MGTKFYIIAALPLLAFAGVFAFVIWAGKGKSPRRRSSVF